MTSRPCPGRRGVPATGRPAGLNPGLIAGLTAGLIAGLVTSLAGCSVVEEATDRAVASNRPTVVVSTEILADLVRQVGGDRVDVRTVIPPGGDPHSYEPTPSDAAVVAAADVAFTNHLLLEQQSLIKLFDTTVPEGAPNVSLAENAEQYGAALIPLVENVSLDTIWLGLAVRGRAERRTDEIHLRATAVEGPGRLRVYLTETLGDPTVYIDSGDGLDDTDVAVLPPAAHTHVNWAFDTRGEYRLTLAADLHTAAGVRPVGSGTFTFAVGVDPRPIADRIGGTVLGDGHTDLAVDLDRRTVFARTDERGDLPAADVVIDVPSNAVEQVPDDPRFGFLGRPGTTIWQLPQAVLGKHVHGEIDPHLWHDARNAKAYVHSIAATLSDVDPDGAATYARNRDAYAATLDALHAEVARIVAPIPKDRRRLVTTHDAFGYLAKAYGFEVTGFVVPNPGQEPSAAQVKQLRASIVDGRVPAVFVEPNLAQRAAVLRQVAADVGVPVCTLHGDTFSPAATTYLDLMRSNARELLRCLAEGAS